MQTNEPVLSELAAKLRHSQLQRDPDLRRLNTWRLGGRGFVLIEAECPEELSHILRWCGQTGMPWRVIGKGSNLLMPEFWPGVLLRLGRAFRQLEKIDRSSVVNLGAGLPDAVVANKLSQWGLGGLEFLIGIPGTLGGAVTMNAGAHGSETKDTLQKVDWLDSEGNWHCSSAYELSFAYRHSPFASPTQSIVLGATFCLREEEPQEVRKKMEKYHQFRIEKQPQRQPNCGSVFRNPVGAAAAHLIEASGLKGKTCGAMQVSRKHSNFMVNLGEATTSDAHRLIELVQKQVWSDHRIELVPEVQVLA